MWKVACAAVSPHLYIQPAEKVACATVSPHLYIQPTETACAVTLPCQLFQHGVGHACKIAMAESYPDMELFTQHTFCLFSLWTGCQQQQCEYPLIGAICWQQKPHSDFPQAVRCMGTGPWHLTCRKVLFCSCGGSTICW